MTARSMWKGVLRVAKHQVKVKLYSAVQDSAVHFHLLSASGGGDKGRVVQRMVRPDTSEVVEPEDIGKAYEVESGVYVRLSESELKSLVPEASRDVTVDSFVPGSAIGAGWYERPYYLGPDGDDEAYFSLVEALKKSGKVGIAHWVMRNKQYHGALRAEGEHLVLVTLRTLEEVVQAPKASGGEHSVSEREMKMATQLVEALEDDFDPSSFKDEHSERLLQLIRAKAKGKKFPKHAPPKKAAVKSLSSALEASLKGIAPKKHATRATKEEKKSA